VYSLKVSITSGARYHLVVKVSDPCKSASGEDGVPGSDVFCHEGAAVVSDVGWGTGGASEAEVADLFGRSWVRARSEGSEDLP
jgi:hypothetical protein